MNDMIGVSGLEAVYEDELRGKDGVRPSPAARTASSWGLR